MRARTRKAAPPPVDEQFLKRFKAAPNVLRLEPRQIDPYLSSLKQRLADLYKVLLAPEASGFATPGDDRVDSRPEAGYFVGKLMAFVDCLRLKFRLQEKEAATLPLTIDPTGSGFPHLRDLWFYNEDHVLAGEVLKALDHDAIMKSALNKIFRGEHPTGEQILKVKTDYYRLIESSHHLKDFEMLKPRCLKARASERLYRLDTYSFDGRYNVFLFLQLVFSIKGRQRLEPYWDEPVGRMGHPSAPLIEARLREASVQSLDVLARHLETIPGLAPKLVKRYTIGPYHDEVTHDSEETARLIFDHGASILRFHVETIMSRGRQSDANLLKRMWAGINRDRSAQQLLSPPERLNCLIVPFKLKQVLGEADEFGVDARVFGVTRTGGIIA